LQEAEKLGITIVGIGFRRTEDVKAFKRYIQLDDKEPELVVEIILKSARHKTMHGTLPEGDLRETLGLSVERATATLARELITMPVTQAEDRKFEGASGPAADSRQTGDHGSSGAVPLEVAQAIAVKAIKENTRVSIRESQVTALSQMVGEANFVKPEVYTLPRSEMLGAEEHNAIWAQIAGRLIIVIADDVEDQLREISHEILAFRFEQIANDKKHSQAEAANENPHELAVMGEAGSAQKPQRLEDAAKQSDRRGPDYASGQDPITQKFANNKPILKIISDAQSAEKRGDFEGALRNYNRLVEFSKGLADVLAEYKELLQFAQGKVEEIKSRHSTQAAKEQVGNVQDKTFGGSVLRIHQDISEADIGRELLSEIGLAVTEAHQEARAEADAAGRAGHILNNCLPLSRHLARKFPKERAGLLGCADLHKGRHPEGWRQPIIGSNHWVTYITKGNLHIGIDITAKSYIESGLIDAEVFIAGSREELEKKLMEYYGGVSWQTYREMYPVSSKAGKNIFRVNGEDLDLRDFLEKDVEISFQDKGQKQVLRGILEDYSIDSEDSSLYLHVDNGTVEGRMLRLWNRPPTSEEMQRPLFVGLFCTIINIKISKPSSTGPLSAPQVAVQTNKTAGGIDFRALPIVTQAVSNLRAQIGASGMGALQRMNLSEEWGQIEQMVSGGIIPSSERIKEFIQASCAQGTAERDVEKVISCISGILRQEEEGCCSTDNTLRDILVVLEATNSGAELHKVFLGV
jgi:hypothetical protein